MNPVGADQHVAVDQRHDMPRCGRRSGPARCRSSRSKRLEPVIDMDHLVGPARARSASCEDALQAAAVDRELRERPPRPSIPRRSARIDLPAPVRHHQRAGTDGDASSSSSRPSAASTATAGGRMLNPTPSSRTASACSNTSTVMPRRCRHSAAVRPPIPAPTTIGLHRSGGAGDDLADRRSSPRSQPAARSTDGAAPSRPVTVRVMCP